MSLNEASAPEYEYWANLAAQNEEAGNNEQAAQHYGMAGQQAAAQYAYDQAANFLSQALRLTPDTLITARYALLLAREGIFATQGKRESQFQDLTSLAQLSEILNDNGIRAEVKVRQASYFESMGDYQAAITLAQSAHRFAWLALDKNTEAASYLVWGKALLRQSDYNAAFIQLNKALTLAKSSPQLQADGLRYLGLLSLEQGNLAKAEEHYEQALEIYHTLDDRHGESYILNNLGQSAYARGSLSVAKTYWHQALDAYREIDDQSGQGMVLNNLSALYLDLGNYDQSQAFNWEMLTLCRQIGLKYGEGMALISLGLTHLYQNMNEAALDFSRQALQIATEMGCPRLQGYALTTLGKVLTNLNQLIEAGEVFSSSITTWQALNQPALVMESQAGLANVALLKSQKDHALAHTEIILAYLAQGKTLEGAESPFAIFWICYQVLLTNQMAEADDILGTGHTLLQAWAAEIEDEADRRSFLQDNVIHQQIIMATSS